MRKSFLPLSGLGYKVVMAGNMTVGQSSRRRLAQVSPLLSSSMPSVVMRIQYSLTLSGIYIQGDDGIALKCVMKAKSIFKIHPETSEVRKKEM